MDARHPRRILADRFPSLMAVALPIALLCGLGAPPLGAAVVPEASALRDKTLHHPDLHISSLERPLAELPPGSVPANRAQDLVRLGIGSDSGFYDLRGGRWGSLILSEPLAPGTGKGNKVRWSDLGTAEPQGESQVKEQVWQALTAYLRAHQEQLRVDLAELGSPRVGVFEEGNIIQVHSQRVAGGIAVRDSGLTAIINHGNLVLLGLQNWGAMDAPTTPAIGLGDAEGVVLEHLRPFGASRFGQDAHLEVIPMARPGDAGSITDGMGYDYHLAWVLRPVVETDEMGAWEALVDATSGELLSFEDVNQYAFRKVMGGVYPVSNDQFAPDGVEQAGWPMPFANITGAVTGFTTSGGMINSPAGTISTTLSGQFIRIADTCGAINESSSTDLDLGSGPTPAATDCTVPAGHSVGDTKSARSGFYELNRINEQARSYLPANTWLQAQLTANMNLNQTCNAFWNGSTVNFFRSAISSGCRNTGEIAAIFDHEWGHGLDNNGVNPNISSPGEAIADITAAMRLDISCMGRGFFTSQVCGGYGDACDGTVAGGGCSGIRDIDFMNHRCNQPHTITWAISGFTSAQCGGTGAAPACPAGSGTPCGRETHCEGYVAGETAWDLQFRDLRAAPFNYDPDTALVLGTRLAYLGQQSLTSWYTCSVGGGCGATGGYMLWLAMDDDNGNINDGTPHMTAIRAAFERHQIHCATPTPVNSGCAGGPTTATTLSGTALDQGASLTWTGVTGAAHYYVYRTDGVLGCSFGRTKVGETTGLSFIDSGLQNGRTYYYSILPVGSNLSCFGPFSNCLPVIPGSVPTTEDLAITKTDGVTTVVAGQPVTYTIVASNAGPDVAAGATVTDTFPATITNVTWTCAASGGSSCTASGTGNISQSVSLAVGGTVTFTATGTVSPGATGSITNTATVAAPPAGTDPVPGNNTASDTDTVTQQADMSITKTDGSTTAVPGQPVTYTIVVGDLGPSSATGATVTDNFPAAISGVTWTCTATAGSSCGAASGSGNIAQTVNVAAPAGTVTFTATGMVSSGATGTLSNTATVAPPTGVPDPVPGNNSATDTDTLSPVADLSITKTDGQTLARPGQPVTYTIVASNTSGPSSVTGAVVTDTLPAVLTGGTWTCVGASGGTCTASGTGNIADTVNLPVTGTVTYTLTATLSPTASGTLTNTATVAPPTGATDPTPGNNSASDTDTITLMFYTVQPCRVLDTRVTGPALAANSLRTFTVGGMCGIPADAKAVAFNVTVVGETDSGDLRVFPAGGFVPLASTINFVTAHVRANNALIPLGTSGQVSVVCDMPTGSTGQTHLVLDVYGYFR